MAWAQSPLWNDVSASTTSTSTSTHYVFTQRDVKGCILQFFAMLFASASRLLMKQTEGILTAEEVVQVNNIFNTLIPALYSVIITDPSVWKAYSHVSWQSLTAFFSISVLVYTIGGVSQMKLIRSMGPGVYSSFSGLGVLGSVVLSAWLLHEPVQNGLEWVGLCLTMVTMTVYTYALSNWEKKKKNTNDNNSNSNKNTSTGDGYGDDEEDELDESGQGIVMSSTKEWTSVPTTDLEELEEDAYTDFAASSSPPPSRRLEVG